MIPPLKDQALEFENGSLKRKPLCPTCKKKDAFVYNAMRQQFQCGLCWHEDYKAVQEVQQQAAQEMIERIRNKKCTES